MKRRALELTSVCFLNTDKVFKSFLRYIFLGRCWTGPQFSEYKISSDGKKKELKKDISRSLAPVLNFTLTRSKAPFSRGFPAFKMAVGWPA